MNKKQIETLLHYVTIAMEQANKYKEMYDSMPNNLSLHYEKPLSNEEIDYLEIAHCDLEFQLKNYKISKNLKFSEYINKNCQDISEFGIVDDIDSILTEYNTSLKENDCVNCKEHKAIICDSCVSSIASSIGDSMH